MKPTIFVDIESEHAHNPIEQALKAVSFGAEPVELLVQDGVEADIAVTNSVTIALGMVKQTTQTSIVIVHFGRRAREEARSFASQYPDRVSAVPYLRGDEDETEIVPFLLQLIADKAKNPATS